MIITFIEIAGFRGFRDRVRLDIPAGFAVVTGRNGVGKSTVCDAIEFALSGAISKYQVETSGNESLADYYWWRGASLAKEHFVSVGFQDGNGRETILTRTRDGGANISSDAIERLVCATGDAPDQAIEQLCRTSIIRDELIAQLSLDQTDTKRFEFVSKALGAIQGPEHEKRAAAVLKEAEGAFARATAAYETAGERLSEALADVTRAKDEAASGSDVQTAIMTLAGLVPFDSANLASSIGEARMRLSDLRRGLAEVHRRVEMAASARQLIQENDTHERRAEIRRLETEIAELQDELNRNRDRLIQSEQALAEHKQHDEIAAALAGLIADGQKLGLHDESCPLCAASRTEAEFAAGIEAAKQRLGRHGEAVATAQRTVDEERLALSELQTRLAGRKAHRADLSAPLINAQAVLEDSPTFFSERLPDLGIGTIAFEDLASVERAVLARHSQLVRMETAVITLEASSSVGRVEDAEAKAEALRVARDEAADAAATAERALDVAKKIVNEGKRAGGEIINERLALISPLLNELYQRLRPHAEWRDIEYKVRGDLRRYLSLRVGNDLNPSFVFSSGQRRAAGIAFLLSVHLARAWCAWRTLVLDDPVQHIDDFRALQLVEVLAALRHNKRQVICAIEDPDLADLLARRLRSSPDSPGAVFELKHGSGGSGVLSEQRHVEVPPEGVLRRTSGVSVAL